VKTRWNRPDQAGVVLELKNVQDEKSERQWCGQLAVAAKALLLSEAPVDDGRVAFGDDVEG